MGRWKRAALTDVAREISVRNGGRLGVDRVMGVLKYEGLVPMRERTIAKDLARYKVVPPRAFAYNPMRLNIGSIAYSWHDQDVLVSPDYEVFEARADCLHARFLDQVRRSAAWANFVQRAGNGSVRVRIYFQDLAQFVFQLPPLDEQQRIAAVLDAIDREIAVLERQLAAYRRLKRGLMQKLLTGEIGAT
jgi:type I restriction enzyme S subunit